MSELATDVVHAGATGTARAHSTAECYRVLRPGGELHVADWGRPHNAVMWLASWSVRLFNGSRTADNLQGRLPQLCREARFSTTAETTRFATVFGTPSLYRAEKPRV